MPPLILASTSPRRRTLLALLGLPYTIISPDVDETVLLNETPPKTARRLARLKALTVACAHPNAVVLAADTVVALGDEILGKPVDAEDAKRTLKRLRAVRHWVYSGVAVAHGEQVWDDVVGTEVWMRTYSDTEIEAYVASGDPLDKAGSYAIQHPTFAPVSHFHGCLANVVGLPLCTARRLLFAAGLSLPSSLVEACAPPLVCAVPRTLE